MSRLAGVARYLALLFCLSVGAAHAGTPGIDGAVTAIEGGRVVLDIGTEAGAEPGRTVFFYRYYPHVADAVSGGSLAGHTYLGSGVLERVDAASSVATVAFLELRPGDLVRLAPPAVLALTEDARWVPEGIEQLALRDPFLQRRRLNNRIQVVAEAARMGEADYYLGTNVDFTYWPMMKSGNLTWVEAMRFGLGAFQGEAPALSGEPEVEPQRFLFGMAEFDLRLVSWLNVLPSLKIGLNNSGFGAGAGMKMRLGSIQNSHFLVGGEISRNIGWLAFMEYHHFPTRDLQFWVRTGAENLPSGQRRGGRAQLGAEYRLTRMVWLRAAVGVGGRRAIEGRERGINGELGMSWNFWTGRQ